MKKFAQAILAAAAALTLSAPGLAGAPVGAWYIAPQVNAIWLDDARQADDDAGVTFAFGRTLSENWDAQIAMFGSEHDRAGNNNTLELQGFGLSANRIFYRDARVNPFISFGLARVKSIYKPGLDDADLSAIGGVGLLANLGHERDDGSAIQLRADLGARRTLSSNWRFFSTLIPPDVLIAYSDSFTRVLR